MSRPRTAIRLRPLVPADLWAIVNSNPRVTATETPTGVRAMVDVSHCRTIVGADRHPLACLVLYPSTPGTALFITYRRGDFSVYERPALAAMRRFLARALLDWPIITATVARAAVDDARLLAALKFKPVPAGLQTSTGRTTYMRGRSRPAETLEGSGRAAA